MVSSNELFNLDIAPDTFYFFGDGETIFTDDEIPIDLVIIKIRDSIKENQEEFSNLRRPKHFFDDPRFIVLAKADFDRLHSFTNTNLSRDPLSTEQVTTDVRCLFLNDIARKVGAPYKDDAATI